MVSVQLNVRRLGWQMTTQGDETWYIPGEGGSVFSKPSELRDVRQSLLEIRTPSEGLKFFRRYQCAWVGPRDLIKAGPPLGLGRRSGYPSPVRFSELQIVQRLVQLLASAPKKRDLLTFIDAQGPKPRIPEYLLNQMMAPDDFHLEEAMLNPPRLRFVYCGNFDLIQALTTLAMIEHLGASKHRVCARVGCGKTFVQYDPRQKYHAPVCAHRAAQSRYEERKKKGGC